MRTSPWVVLQAVSLALLSARTAEAKIDAGVELGGVSPINGYGEVSYRIMDDFQNQLVIAAGIRF